MAAVLTLVCYGLLVHTSAGSNLDVNAFRGGLQDHTQPFRFVDSQLGRIDSRSLKITMLALLGIGLARGRVILGMAAALAAGAPVAAAHVLRYHILDRHPFTTGGFVGSSFPSDHVTAVVGSAMALVLVCPPRIRGLVGVVGAVLGAAVAAQVQAIGWHQVVDAIGGALLAFVFVTAIAGGVALIGRKDVSEGEPSLAFGSRSRRDRPDRFGGGTACMLPWAGSS